MKRTLAFVLLTVVVLALSSLQPRTVDPQQESLPSVLLPRAPFDAMLPPVKGMAREEAWRILERHYDELMQLADIEGITLGSEGIIILTDDPARLPKDVEGLPIEVRPPLRPATIAGRPYKEAEAILERHREELSRLPDVDQVSLGLEGILVATDDPSVLPAEVEGLPIIAGPPVTHIPSSGGIPYKQAKAILDRQGEYLRGLPEVENVILGMEGILVFTDNPGVLPKDVEGLVVVPRVPDRFPRIHGLPYEEAQAIFERNQEMLRHLPGVQDVGLNLDAGLVVRTDNPAAVPKTVEGLPITIMPSIKLPKTSKLPAPLLVTPTPEVPAQHERPAPVPKLNLLPPPPGVVVLKSGKVREQAEKCPGDFNEVEGYGGWRFCVDPQNPQPIPPLWSPPIAGIPYEEVLEIYQRHLPALSKLPGIVGIGVGEGGIHIETNNSEVVPKEVEGVPIIIRPATGVPWTAASHTLSTSVPYLHGAVGIAQFADSRGVLTGVALSAGRPWLIFPAHVINTCNIDSPCPLSTAPLNSCQHYFPPPGQTVPIVVQPPTGSPVPVGFAQRWTRLGGLSSNDVAAAFMDTDTTEGNGSLSADRKVEADVAIPFSGIPAPISPGPSPMPPPGLQVTMRRALGPPHSIPLIVQEVPHTAGGVQHCPNQPYNATNQIRYILAPGSPSSFR